MLLKLGVSNADVEDINTATNGTTNEPTEAKEAKRKEVTILKLMLLYQ